jgi:protein MpaA
MLLKFLNSFFLFLILIEANSYALAPSIENVAGKVTLNPQQKMKVMEDFCQKVNGAFEDFGWRKIICKASRWEFDYMTEQGHPLLYQTFFNNKDSQDRTLFFCSIHGDELPSTYLCVHMVRDIIYDHPEKYKNANVIIAPMINPDSFLSNNPGRTNARGVDLNRNFPTSDWNELALHMWKKRYKSNPRRYPGPQGGSEIETQFQVELIKRFRPSKIVSIHGPYGFWDYDLIKKDMAFWKETRTLAYKMAKASRNFPVNDFRTFPGSLGNFAGNDFQIPTYTLELAGADPKKGHGYWGRFKDALRLAANYQFRYKSQSHKKVKLSSSN